MRVLEILAKAAAVLAGLLLTAITLMTVASVVGRNTTGWTLVGDFELAGSAAGAAIALFLPWCQWERGHIIVDFFTTRASDAAREGLDRFGALVLAAVLALMTWRSAIGGFKAWESQTGSMMLGFPDWIVYTGIVPGLGLAAVIALAQAAWGFGAAAEAQP
ncbi:MAG: TRAP transporter small permease [Betaproteobacteria bacterium]|jgi:TRAP-type C4-dicarboxylate transport system permease small subunit